MLVALGAGMGWSPPSSAGQGAAGWWGAWHGRGCALQPAKKMGSVPGSVSVASAKPWRFTSASSGLTSRASFTLC